MLGYVSAANGSRHGGERLTVPGVGTKTARLKGRYHGQAVGA